MATSTRFPSRVPGWGPRPAGTPVPAAETGPWPAPLPVDPVRVRIVDDDAPEPPALPDSGRDADLGRLGAGQPAVSESTFAERLWIRSRGQVQVVDVGDIEWIESDLRYCWIHLTSGEKRKVREPISRVESRLDPARFVRVHRSVIVHLDRVAEAISSTQAKAIVLKNGTRLPMSRSGRRRVFSPRAPR